MTMRVCGSPGHDGWARSRRGLTYRSDRSGESAKVEVGAIDPLHRHAEHFLLPAGRVELDRFKEGHQRRAVVPRRVLARDEHVVTAQRRERHRGDVFEAEILRKLAELAFDVEEHPCE